MEKDEPFIVVPTWEDGVWSHTSFPTREHFKQLILTLFVEPGKYDFDESSFQFNAQARAYSRNKYYTTAPYMSKDYIKYWDTEKEKCRSGVIFKHRGSTWYLPREYYMWVNFLPIFDKTKKDFDFPEVRDAQYHLALYELLAELHFEHAALLKKRQVASSYFHAAKLINLMWFEPGVTLKMGASLKDYVNESGTWAYLEEYREFLNSNTAWYRPLNPGKPMKWEQKIQEKSRGTKRWKTKGNKSRLIGLSFEQSRTRGVGGPCRFFFYEEGGIAPTADDTYQYILPAMQDGMITTGLFAIAGSVGDLKDCEPLRKMILKPKARQIYAVWTNLIDKKGTWGWSGLFIPEQWSMPPYIDQYGNSLVEEALKAIIEQRKQWERDLDPNEYQLKISQAPINIEEAFAIREESKFPVHLIAAQIKRIEEKTYAYEHLDIVRDETGKPIFKESNKLPITDFPVPKKMEDKTGIPVVWERPVKDPVFNAYCATLDPVGEGKTTTSESLCSLYIYKNDVQVTRRKVDGTTETFIEQGKLVAAWCGRFDDINKSHERIEMMLEMYNAWCVVENNVSLFIQYMIMRRKERFLVPKNQILFLKHIGANMEVFQEYGWKNTGRMFKDHLLSYAIQFVNEEIDSVTLEDGTVIKVIYGVERIPDVMLLTEMIQYQDGLNVDRLVSFAALAAFVKIQHANRGYTHRIEEEKDTKSQKSSNFDVKRGAFRHIGQGTGQSSKYPRNPFRNLK